MLAPLSGLIAPMGEYPSVPASADYNTSQALQMCPGSSASICTFTHFLQMVTPMKIFLYLYLYIENGTYNQYA